MDFTKQYIETIKSEFMRLSKRQIYKYLVAIETNSILWSDATKLLGDKIPVKSGHGINLMSVDLKIAYRVQYCTSNQHASWPDLGPFFAYCATYVKPEKMILVTNQDYGLTKLVHMTLSDHLICDFAELLKKHTKNIEKSKEFEDKIAELIDAEIKNTPKYKSRMNPKEN